jgi:hypothetical protein
MGLSMKKSHSLWLLVAVSGVLCVLAALVSCAPDTSAPELKMPAQVAQVDEPQPGAEGGPPEISTAAFVDQECLDCHTDQEALQRLAVEEEGEAESLSEGPG